MTRHDPTLMHRGLLAVRRNTIRRLLNAVFGIAQLRDGQQRVLVQVGQVPGMIGMLIAEHPPALAWAHGGEKTSIGAAQF